MDLVQELNEVVGRLAEADPFCHSDAASMRALCRTRALFDYALSAAAASFAQSGEWALEGAASAAAWLSTTCHLPLVEARRLVRRGQALSSLPLVTQAFSLGEIGVAQVDRLLKAAQAVQRANPEAFAHCEAALVAAAKELSFTPFCTAVEYFSQRADPDGAQEGDMAKRARRDVFVHQSLNGLYLGSMVLDPLSGAQVSAELSRLERQGFEADWAQAKAQLGREPRLEQLARTSAQRRADALVEMAQRSAAAGPHERRPVPLLSILVGYESLYGPICRIEGGPIIAAGSLLPLLEKADFERIVFAPGTRIECSPTQRFFTGATRRAIEVRDQACTHPFCETRAQKCQIDHIIPYSQGGLSTQDNGRVLCGFHNRLRNHGSGDGDRGDGDRGGDRDRGGGDGGEQGRDHLEEEFDDTGGP